MGYGGGGIVPRHGRGEYQQHAMLLGRDLLKRQNTEYLEGQKQVRGFWMQGEQPYLEIPESAVPPLALLKLYDTFLGAEDREKWLDAVRLHADEYLLTMSSRNAYRIIPLGMALGSPTPEKYRPLAGKLNYRYFYPTRHGFWWQGANCHYAANALAAGIARKDSRRRREEVCGAGLPSDWSGSWEQIRSRHR